jgi:hypothetical protein
MADRHAVADLFARYAWANDTHDVSIVEELFAPELQFSITIAGDAAVGPFDGRDATLAFFGDAFGGQSDQRRHITTNLRFVEESDDAAKVVAYLLIASTADGKASVVCTGLYDVAVALRDGAWVFTSMLIALDSGF